MSTENKLDAPAFQEPPEKKIKLPEGSINAPEPPLDIVYIEKSDKNWWALAFNIVLLLSIFVVTHLVMSLRTDARFWTMFFPSLLVSVVIATTYHKAWVNTAEQTGDLFMDIFFSSRLIVCEQGGRFMTITSRWVRNANFVKHIQMSDDGKNIVELEFGTKGDGFVAVAQILILAKRKPGKKANSNGFRYTDGAIAASCIGEIQEALTRMGSCNSWDTLQQNQDKVLTFTASIFGGNDNESPFEQRTGTLVEINLRSLRLTDASQELYKGKTKGRVTADTIRELKTIEGITTERAAEIAEKAELGVTQTIVTYEGKNLPPGLQTLALGDSGIAVSDIKKGGKK